MKRIIDTTDGQFIGRVIDLEKPIDLDGYIFVPDEIADLPDGITRLSNSSYVIDVSEIA